MRKPKNTSATYVYCVTRGGRPPPLSRAPRGLPGSGRPRALAVSRSLWLVVADAPLERYGEPAIERGLRELEWVGACAAGHERVVEHVAERHTTVPMKLFTLFASDDRAVGHARALAARIARVAERVDGCREWGVRVHVDERRARAAARRSAEATASRTGRGTSFLVMRKAEHSGVRDALRDARHHADGAFSVLAQSARDSVVRPPVSREVAARVLLDAVFLVPSARARTFRSAVSRVQTALSKRGCEVTLTGPWPPYHFVDSVRRGAR
jgi:hypothetical protein